jgi:hypothetical protein
MSSISKTPNSKYQYQTRINYEGREPNLIFVRMQDIPLEVNAPEAAARRYILGPLFRKLFITLCASLGFRVWDLNLLLD